MKLQLDDLALFTRVAELGTLSAAARERDTPVSQVTRSIARLESACGARLMHRTTHGLSLTDEGDTVLAHARQMLDSAQSLQADLTGRLAGPAGWVRVGTSAVLAQAVVAASLPALHERHPALHLDICADDRLVDMARDGIDVALRTGSPASDALVARQVGRLTRGLFAAPSYVARHGLPADEAELATHRLIGNTASPALNQWAMGHGRDAAAFQVRAHTRCSDTATVLALVLHGAGIGRIVDLVARPHLRSGALVPVLPERFGEMPVPMFAVMLRERHRLPKVRACIDFWAEWLAAR